jgi:hypothetical protein
MRGDLQVLSRIEKRDRRLDRSGRSLGRRLSKTARNRSRGYSTVRAQCYSPSDFANCCEITAHKNTLATRRRLLREKAGGKRAFNVAELVDELEDVLAVIVSVRDVGGPEHIAEAATTKECSVQTISHAGVCLFSNDTERYILKKLHLEDGQQLFYVVKSDALDDSHECPWALGLDRRTYDRIKTQASKMHGLKLLESDHL